MACRLLVNGDVALTSPMRRALFSVVAMTAVGSLAGCTASAATDSSAPSSAAAGSSKPSPSGPSSLWLRSPRLRSSSPPPSPEQLGKTLFQDRWTSWENANSTKAVAAGYGSFKGSSAQYAKNLAAKNATVYGDALFQDGWQSDSSLSSEVNYRAGQNEAVLIGYIATSSQEHPYEWHMTVDSVKVAGKSDQSIELIVDYTNHNDGAENTYGTTINPVVASLNGAKTEYDVTLVKTAGFWKILTLSSVALQ